MVSLDAGHYTIDEINYPQIETELREAIGGFIVITVEVSGDCTEFEGATAEGDISAGEEQTCSITNVIEELA